MNPSISILGMNVLDLAVVCGIVLVACLGIALGALRFLASLLPLAAGLAVAWLFHQPMGVLLSDLLGVPLWGAGFVAAALLFGLAVSPMALLTLILPRRVRRFSLVRLPDRLLGMGLAFLVGTMLVPGAFHLLGQLNLPSVQQLLHSSFIGWLLGF